MRLCSTWIVAVGLMMCGIARGANVPPQKAAAKSSAPDIEFLEYLGTLESEDENWTDIVEMQREKQADTPKPNSSADAKSKPAPSPPRRVDTSNER